MGRGGSNNLLIDANTVETVSVANKQLIVPDQGFNLRESADKQHILVFPSKGLALKASSWDNNTRWFRSLMFNRESREIVSVGFPKFFNYNESLTDTETLNNNLAGNNPVYFTEKMDGSLIIRSVINGQVNFRTRGTIDETLHSQTAAKVAASKYSVLLDPEFMPGKSTLFELVSPNPELKIVIDYQEDDLVLLGQVEHNTLRQTTTDELQQLAADEKLRAVEIKKLPTQPEQLLQTISQWTDCEGIVARYNNDQEMLKIKSADYLSRHRLRYALSAKVIRSVCLERDVRDLNDFEKYLAEQGGDWEMATDARPLVEKFLTTRESTERELNRLKQEVEIKKTTYPERKDFAQQYAVKLPGAQKSVAFALLDNKEQQAAETLLKKNLDQAFQKFEAAEEEDL